MVRFAVFTALVRLLWAVNSPRISKQTQGDQSEFPGCCREIDFELRKWPYAQEPERGYQHLRECSLPCPHLLYTAKPGPMHSLAPHCLCCHTHSPILVGGGLLQNSEDGSDLIPNSTKSFSGLKGLTDFSVQRDAPSPS